jgi:hypothetical protein
MLESGRCYAKQQPTACVFHSMRVAEFGLRALARKANVSLISKKGKRCPIEFADWQKVLTGIENKIVAARLKPAGPKKNAEIMFLSDAASHCTHLRDIYRNEISHTRKRYNMAEAFAAYSRVADFMKLLSRGLYPGEQRNRMIIANSKRIESMGDLYSN